ncbi:uncharacterized protein EKO05_0008130 [Ascochyta rabiei]|uniref:uncharacterized protein n=1 Tax=Didymella rabiei TaxID=5454 RepID=UPI001901F3BD|nr:uncharacterized protein EKO05_0008130 [Ascochyta rabiei]UPX17793.1 hypothetical protein EKO05_0008130 [Ascochyta rabiei]
MNPLTTHNQQPIHDPTPPHPLSLHSEPTTSPKRTLKMPPHRPSKEPTLPSTAKSEPHYIHTASGLQSINPKPPPAPAPARGTAHHLPPDQRCVSHPLSAAGQLFAPACHLPAEHVAVAAAQGGERGAQEQGGDAD